VDAVLDGFPKENVCPLEGTLASGVSGRTARSIPDEETAGIEGTISCAVAEPTIRHKIAYLKIPFIFCTPHRDVFSPVTNQVVKTSAVCMSEK
jgi:hypothetical protein